MNAQLLHFGLGHTSQSPIILACFDLELFNLWMSWVLKKELLFIRSTLAIFLVHVTGVSRGANVRNRCFNLGVT